ncbi:MAG: metallophosphoesterase [Chthoniobacter sp.]|nr:metallophosphoesterase [Chthoniobacter sp.]
MPFHIPPISRREFLRRSLVAGAGLLTIPALRAAESKADPNRWALFSDTHVAADATMVRFDVNMADHLRAVVDGVRALSTPPAGVLVNGDCAFNHGLAEDYATFTGLLNPLHEAGLPLHLALGNHDDREVFWGAIKDARPAAPPLASRQVSIVEAGHANWFMLDSLDVTNKTPGVLGDEQRTWLSKALDARADKPALVMVHHNPVFAEGKQTGLTDTAELMEILKPRRHVKALVFGHTHTWRMTGQDGLHLVNLPAIGYPFNKAEVTGWVDCNLRADGMSLEVHAHDTAHPAHGKVSQLNWRTA